jgi:TDG/mug DNA glycosylase family protein
MASIDSPLGLSDLLANDLDVVFCGINPALRSAIAGHHFSNRSNRFWRVLHQAGFTPEQLLPENDRTILNHRCGLTAAVDRPTTRADELATHEFLASASALAQKIEQYAPRYLAFLGKPAFSAITGQRNVQWGPQSMIFGGASVWVLPNPSGLNRSFSLDDLVSAYRELRLAVNSFSPKCDSSLHSESIPRSHNL